MKAGFPADRRLDERISGLDESGQIIGLSGL
jgi:hypothetical protein